jgi:uncharacterized membrane protein
MENMLVVIFDTAPQALKGVIDLNALHRAGDIILYSTAVITKEPSGRVSIKQASEREMNAAPLGFLAGTLVGTLGGPIGLAIGASIGGLAGLIFDLAKTGVSATFLKEASQALAPGQTALLAEIDEVAQDSVDSKLVKLGGHISRRPRSEFVEDQMLDELDAIKAELN